MTRVVVGFVHDFAAGIWASTVLTVFWLEAAAAEAPSVVVPLQERFFWIGCVSIVLVLATGAGRTFTYVDGVYGEGAEAARRKALIVKHIVLFAVFGAGALWQYRMAFS